MKLKCFFGKHNYSSYNDVKRVPKIHFPGETVCTETCNRICSDCKKMSYFTRKVDTLNTHSTTNWRKIHRSRYYKNLIEI
jgi:hypothetical protein